MALLPPGTYVRTDALALTCDGFNEGDEIKTDSDVFYEVKAVRDIFYSPNSFSHRELDLVKLPLHELSFSSTAPSVEDARYRTKVYWETYISSENLQNKRWQVSYSNPDYPLVRVFHDKRIEILFTVDTPESKPLMNFTRSPYGYEERAPTHIMTLDTELNHLAETELRNIVETYPSGSQRGLERRRTTIHNFGSTQIFDTEFTLSYRRDTT